MFPRAALLLGLAGLASAQTLCEKHTNCTSAQYCSNYTSSAGATTVACYPCVDAYRYTCTDYGDSVDGSCAQCAEEETLNGEDAYDYINCESHATCADNMYCYSNDYGGFVVQDCWPCSDSSGFSCDDYGDAVDGDCSKCAGSLPTAEGCSAHVDCNAGSYCSSYQNAAGTGVIVACNPCLDTYGYTCEDYADPVDGSCAVCTGYEAAPDATREGPSSPVAEAQCKAPLAPGTPIAFQSCSAHADCRTAEYCSSYMGDAGCVIDCWPCEDMYGLQCSDYNDAIDASCSTCAAGASKARGSSTEPATPGGSCKIHADCALLEYCALIDETQRCTPCTGQGNATCEANADSFNDSCNKCASDAARAASPSDAAGVSGDTGDNWRIFGIVVVVTFALAACGGMFFMIYRVWKAKYGKDDALALRGVVTVRQPEGMPPARDGLVR
ncbi:hypothetical protein KFE25_008960 [Diacronema lutheri]|uniref:EGF-like domain-containing protein n=1 Tax=Diacronema lutheri TaxID=2081491 RepID=A0A8J5Y3S5_DIALT|nr:hypothetical protein KFE25_008960 [Diacronema lutheri]